MNLYEANKMFLRLYGRIYGLKDIQSMDLSLGSPKADVYFVVKTEKDKEKFLIAAFQKCSDKYLKYMKRIPEFNDWNFNFFVLSREDVKKNYSGNYYYAMH